jgi:hypothetical protein
LVIWTQLIKELTEGKNVQLLHAGQRHGLHGKFLNDSTRRGAKTIFTHFFNSTNQVYQLGECD